MTAPVWLRLANTEGRSEVLCVADVWRVLDVGGHRVVYVRDASVSVTDTLDDIAAALGATVPTPAPSVPAPAEVPAWRADADAAVALLVRAGWEESTHDNDGTLTHVFVDEGGAAVITGGCVYRPGTIGRHGRIDSRAGRTLTECARLIIRDAVERGEAPDMDAARAMVAEWDAAGGGA